MATKQVNFSIIHLDPLAQGVSKNEKVYFIANTLPGEVGLAEVYKENKKIAFAKLSNPSFLSVKSKDRIEPRCPHFFDCGGCHYLHMPYKQERSFKQNSFKWIFKKYDFSIKDCFKFFPAKERFNYRNRIQLHYDKSLKIVGFLDSNYNLTEVSNCLNAVPLIQAQFNVDRSDIFEVQLKNAPKKGHFEYYLPSTQIDQKVIMTINSKYSSGGFSQVNNEMNNELKKYLTIYFKKYIFTDILDLFGGQGNLSSIFSQNSYIVDIYNKKEKPPQGNNNQKYLNCNLFQENELLKLYKFCHQTNFMIIDPPRSGFKLIDKVVSHYEPSTILYLSCFPVTMERDLTSLLSIYEIQEVSIFDFFPGTFHYETVLILQKKI